MLKYQQKPPTENYEHNFPENFVTNNKKIQLKTNRYHEMHKHILFAQFVYYTIYTACIQCQLHNAGPERWITMRLLISGVGRYFFYI